LRRGPALLGCLSCILVVFASASSGPVLSLIAAVAALSFWRYRRHLRTVRWAAVGIYVALNMVMKVPAYYIIARLDVTGSSTGWHRAALIEASITHFSEWWLAGTDYTRHWMPTGVSWNPRHTDITNHYVYMGVIGGLPLLIIFITLLAKAFGYIGATLRLRASTPEHSRRLVWALGASLFAHAITFVSVSYFDQTVVFLYITLAAIGSACSAAIRSAPLATRHARDISGAVESSLARQVSVSSQL
jgi:hypothetical protein